jgi:ABC-type uncharacterized transport system, permease component
VTNVERKKKPKRFTGFWEIAMLELKQDMQYKASFMITIFIQPIMIIINIALFTSIYSFNGASQIKGYNLSQMIWYFNGINFVTIIIFNFTEFRLSEKILSGDLIMDLLRPISILKYELATSIGLRMAALIAELSPSIVVYSLIYFPSFMTLFSILRFAVTVFFAFFILYCINFLIGLSAFVFKSNKAMTQIKVLMVSLLGGGAIPLDFYPKSVGSVLDFLPFKYIYYWPTQFLLNMRETQNTRVFIKVCMLQLIWIAILYFASKYLWKKSVQKFCAVG